MAEIRLAGVSKRFGDSMAVDRIDLVVRDKEFLVLVGPSGCGKTTTLRMIAGLEEASAGEIHIGDRLVNDLPPRDRDIAMVFQNYALYPHMSVAKNLAFGLRQRRFPRAEIDLRVKEAARMLGLEGLLHRKPKELSGGQRQRVAMGRAIVRKPQAFLFDEPLSNLDAKLRVQMRVELTKLHQQLGTTVVYVTHDQIEAMTLADQIVVMDKGRIMQTGRTLEVYNHPRNLFVAGFIGSPSMNFFEVRLIAAGDRIVVENQAFRLAVPERLRPALLQAQNQELVLGLRPEHVYDQSLQDRLPQAETLRARVEVVEPIGSQTILLASCACGQLTVCLDPQLNVQAQTDRVFLVDPARIHLFDKATGEAMGG